MTTLDTRNLSVAGAFITMSSSDTVHYGTIKIGCIFRYIEMNLYHFSHCITTI